MLKKDKWFSWGWLIFWCLIGAPEIAIIYLIIKHSEKKKNGRN